MGMTRATKENKLGELEGRIKATKRIAADYRTRAEAAEGRADRMIEERDWLAKAPVIDPLPTLEPVDEPKPAP